MTAMSVAQRMTAEEFIAMPVPERGRPWNLIDGEIVMNDPSARHGAGQETILFALNVWTRAEPGRGRAYFPADIQLDGRNVFVPDVLWYREERRLDLDSPPPYPMPDLAVEVRSPSTWRYDIGAKKAGYESHRLPELWLVDTAAHAVLAYRRSKPASPTFDIALEIECAGELTSPLLPGFALSVSEVFPDR
jgi:Uma2 family endonuclease